MVKLTGCNRAVAGRGPLRFSEVLSAASARCAMGLSVRPSGRVFEPCGLFVTGVQAHIVDGTAVR